MTREYYRGTSGREVFGALIILIGFGLLMNTMGVLPSFPFVPFIQRVWLPAFFIIIGVVILSRRRNDGFFAGVFFILFGFLFLFSGFYFNARQLIGPAILIWIGLAFLMRNSGGREYYRRPLRARRENTGSFTAQSMDSSDFIQASVILGGFNRKSSSTKFRGGDLTAIMGGGKLDLREAVIEGDEAVLDVFALIGGIELQIPTGWSAEPRFTPVLGGYEDRSNPDKETKRLIIQGTTILGGITVSN